MDRLSRYASLSLTSAALLLLVTAPALSQGVELAAPASEFKQPDKLPVEAGGTAGEITYYSVSGKAVIEGDIVLGTIEEIGLIKLMMNAGTDLGKLDVGEDPDAQQKLSQASPGERSLRELGTRAVAIKAMFGGRPRRWPGGVMAYEVDPALPSPQRVKDAITHWEANTNIRFVQRGPSHANYVHFTAAGGGCSSFVGMRGGRQDITIEAACSLGNVIHEIGHALGLQHEQTRGDRDKFVQIVWDNIQPSMRGNFVVNTKQNDDIHQYDYNSLMHYPRTSFAIDPSRETIIPLQAVSIGQRSSLSQGDVAGIQRIYK